MKDPGKFFKNNLANSLQLIEAATFCGVKGFVLSSTAAVYASSDAPLTEDSAIDPANAYGFTKLAIEQASGMVSQDPRVTLCGPALF